MTNNFVNHPLDKLTNRENIFSRMDRVESRTGARPSARVQQLGQIGERTGRLIVDDELVLSADVYPGSALQTWQAVDSNATIAQIVGSYGGALTNSGILIYGQAHDSGVKGLVYLAANNESGVTKTSFVLDTSGVITADMRDGTNTARNTQGLNIKSRVTDLNEANTVLYLDTETTGTPIAGFGTAASFRAYNDSSTMIDLGYVAYRWITPTAGSESSKAVFGVKDGGTAVEALAVSKSGVSIAAGFLNIPATSTLTVASGVVTATGSHHLVDTEAAAATDDLDTINGGTTGDLLILRTANSGRDVTVKDGTGNIDLEGDFTLSNIQDMILLMKINANWREIARANNA